MITHIKTIISVLVLAFLVGSCGQTKTEHIHRSKMATHKSPLKQKLVPLVVIDPGHGAYDLGAHTKHCEEKDLCLKTGLFLRRHLESKGYHVVMTRNRDEYIPLKKRAEMANELRSQVMVSLHFNAAKNTKAHGMEIFYYPKGEPWRMKNSKRLAQTVLAKMLSKTGANSRGIKEGNFCVIRETHMPAILVEGGFITNHDEMLRMRNDHYLDKMAKSIADGLDEYFRSS